MSMCSALPRQLLKVFLYIILFVSFLSALLVGKLSDYFVSFADDKVSYDITINSQMTTNEMESTYNFYHDKQYATNYITDAIELAKMIDEIENNNECICDVNITYNLLTFEQDDMQLYNGKVDFDNRNSWASYLGFDCIAVSNKFFQKIGKLDKYDFDDEYVCLLQEGAFIYDELDNKNLIKKIEIGDKIRLTQLTVDNDGSNDIVFTVVGFVKDDLYLTGSVKQMYIPLNNFVNLASIVKKTFDSEVNMNLRYPCQINEDITIKCNNLNQFSAVKKEIDSKNNKKIFYTSDVFEDAQMIAMASAIGTNMSDLISVLLFLIVLTTVVTAILNVFMRRKEIGLLSSFGEEKKNICIQIIVEQIIIMLLGVPLSILMTKKIAVKLLTYLVTNSSFELLNHQRMYFSQNINLNLMPTDYFKLVVIVTLSLITYGIVTGIAVKRTDPKQLLKG